MRPSEGMRTLRSPILNVGWDVDDDVGFDVDEFPVDGDIADGFADVGIDDGFGEVGFDVEGVLVDGFDEGFADVGFDEGFGDDGFADVGFDDGFGEVGFDVEGVLVDGFDEGFADVGFDEGFGDDVGFDVDGFPVDGDIADGFADVGSDDGFGDVGFDVDGVPPCMPRWYLPLFRRWFASESVDAASVAMLNWRLRNARGLFLAMVMLLSSSSLAPRSMFKDFDVDADRIRLRNLMEMNFMLTVEEQISCCDAKRWEVESNTSELWHNTISLPWNIIVVWFLLSCGNFWHNIFSRHFSAQEIWHGSTGYGKYTKATGREILGRS